MLVPDDQEPDDALKTLVDYTDNLLDTSLSLRITDDESNLTAVLTTLYALTGIAPPLKKTRTSLINYVHTAMTAAPAATTTTTPATTAPLTPDQLSAAFHAIKNLNALLEK